MYLRKMQNDTKKSVMQEEAMSQALVKICENPTKHYAYFY